MGWGGRGRKGGGGRKKERSFQAVLTLTSYTLPLYILVTSDTVSCHGSPASQEETAASSSLSLPLCLPTSLPHCWTRVAKVNRDEITHLQVIVIRSLRVKKKKTILDCSGFISGNLRPDVTGDNSGRTVASGSLTAVLRASSSLFTPIPQFEM